MSDNRDHLESTVSAHAAADEAAAETVRAGEALLPGTTLGRYVVDRLLGEGGMGAVYEAVHRDLKKRVAIKTLHCRISGSPEARARFLREGQAASRIRHEHVVDMYDVGVEGDIPYLVMEYLEGESLAALLEREKRLSVQRVADIMVPVAAALAVAHAHGIVHRDLKPENIYLCEGGGAPRPKVLDFGISKMADNGAGQAHQLTGTSAMLGTPFYMSPEQAQDAKSIDARTDQYSLGVILYEAATGARPFGDQTLYSLLNKIVEGKFDAPLKVVPDLPEAFDALVMRAMARRQEDRFESVSALGVALLEFASDRTRMLHGEGFGDAPPPPRPSGANASPALTPPAQQSYPGSTESIGGGVSPVAPRRSGGTLALAAGVLAVGALGVYFATRGSELPASPARSEAAVEPPRSAASPATTAAPAPTILPVETAAGLAAATASVAPAASPSSKPAARNTPRVVAAPHTAAHKLAPR